MRPPICSALKTQTLLVVRFVPGKAYRQASGVKLIALLALIELIRALRRAAGEGGLSALSVFRDFGFTSQKSSPTYPLIELNSVWQPDPVLGKLHLAKELSPHILVTPDASTRGAAAPSPLPDSIRR